jgi:hypothetical protein
MDPTDPPMTATAARIRRGVLRSMRFEDLAGDFDAIALVRSSVRRLGEGFWLGFGIGILRQTSLV